ncbi:LCP family protein [Clostridium sardiniense]|uniref:LCP family protein n=1 Tax=Clostridium sardiniense TaxID=29369 RepID=UPI003D35898B
MGKFKNMASWKKILLLICLLIILFFGGSFMYIKNLLNKTTKVDINKDNLSINKEITQKLDEDNKIKNIALFGVDSPEGEKGRSDSIMILTIDEKNNELKLSSIMRDSYVNIKGHGEDKITHAYAFGGPELAVSTLNENFNLDIENFITVDFTSLPKIIDEIGGIDLNITEGDLKYIGPSVTKTGNQTLNGEQALAYSRIRYDGGDQMRTQRHRNVIEAIFNKVKKMPVTSYPSLLNETLPLAQTNLSSSEFMTIGTNIASMGVSNMSQYRLPCDTHSKGTNMNGIYYMTFDKKSETNELHNFIYGKTAEE